MKKKLLLLILPMLFSTLSINAQTKIWDFGTDTTNWSAGFVAVGNEVKDNLGLFSGITGTPADPITITDFAQVDANTATWADGYKSTNRLKLNGAGGIDPAAGVEFTPKQRYLYFAAAGSVTIDVWYRLAGTSARVLYVTDGTKIVGSVVGDGTTVPKNATFTYTGGATNLYIFGAGSSFNFYKIVVTGTLGTTKLEPHADGTPAASPQSICGAATVNDLVAQGTNLQWYEDEIGGSPLALETAIIAKTYYVSQTVDNIESNRTSVVVTEKTAPKAGNDGTLTLCAGTIPTAAELFASLTSADIGGTWSGPVSGVYTYTVTNSPCANDTATVTITELPIPSTPITSSVTYCQNQAAIALTASGTTGTLKWYNSETTKTAIVGTPTPNTTATGTVNYYVSQVGANGCESARALVEVIVYPIYNASICYITSDDVDNTKNRIYINNSGNYNVDKYQIYKEGTFAGVYDLIGELGPNQNSFLDSNSDNSASSYKYKVKTKDISGLISADNSAISHKTILLQSSVATNNNVNLTWTTYDGITYGTYNIYRKVNDGVFELLNSISSSNLSYTDVSADTSLNRYSYYVSIAISPCSTSNNKLANKKIAATTEIRSNYKTISAAVLDTNDNTLDTQIKVYPNPTSQLLYVSHPVQNSFSISITDLNGKQIHSGIITTASPLDIANYPQGMYIVTISSTETSTKNSYKIIKK